MTEIRGTKDGDCFKIAFPRRIDSNNALEVENQIKSITRDVKDRAIVLDMESLEYISSAGLRVILHVKKMCSALRIVNVRSEIYEILDMTGFTQMLTVEKAYRVVSVEGCEEIGCGANGKLYRIDQDNVVKVYKRADALAEIQHEREVARTALVLGIPTAISYDVVRVGESYGSVFEMLDAHSFSSILDREPEKLDWCVKEYVELLKKIHSTVVPSGKLPDMRETGLEWASFVKDYLPETAGDKLLSLVKAIPHDDHMIHGDYHTKNLMLQGDEVLLIDMDTLAVGHPVFELASMYNAYIGFYEYGDVDDEPFLGFDLELAKVFWQKTLAAYLDTQDADTLRSVEDKARILGYTRLIRRAVRRQTLKTEWGRAEVALWKGELLSLLEHVDTLIF